jgi:polar amino acid transport system substrate-binding protein
MLRTVAASLVLLAVLALPAWAQEAKPTQRVATRVIPPFVVQDNGRLTGFSIELWRAVEDDLHLQSEFKTFPTVKDLLGAVQSRQAEAGIAAISITSERERTLDFSQPFFESGLQILVRDEGSPGSAIRQMVRTLFSLNTLLALGLILLLILIPAHLIWFTERRREDSIVHHQGYVPGIFTAIWWSAATLGAQADEMPKSPFGRFVAIVWMFVSVVFIAYFTAAVTSSLTVQQLQGDINGPDDLPGKRVATVRGSTAATYLREHHVQVSEYEKIAQVYDALVQRQADAVVYDAPILLYWIAHEGRGRGHLVGDVFRRESYGIAFPQGSPLRKPVNVALLHLRENGTYQDIYDHWFGTE